MGKKNIKIQLVIDFIAACAQIDSYIQQKEEHIHGETGDDAGKRVERKKKSEIDCGEIVNNVMQAVS